MFRVVVLLESVAVRKCRSDERKQGSAENFFDIKLGVHVSGKHEDPRCTTLRNPSPNMNFVGMFRTTLELWLFPFASETQLGMLLHVYGAFICEDYVVKRFTIFLALQTELQAFYPVWLSYKLTIFRTSLHPAKFFPKPLDFAFGEVDSKLFVDLFLEVGSCQFIVLLHLVVDESHQLWGHIFRTPAWQRGIFEGLSLLKTSGDFEDGVFRDLRDGAVGDFGDGMPVEDFREGDVRDFGDGIRDDGSSNSVEDSGNMDQLGEEGDGFLQEAIKIRSGSNSVGNFARKIVEVIFQPGELEGRNCSGTRGKMLIDQGKLGMVRKYVFKMYPCGQAQEDAQWRKCIVAIDEYLRRAKGKGNGQK